jgi:hypothetical protein
VQIIGEGSGNRYAVGQNGIAESCFQGRGGEDKQVTSKQGVMHVKEMEAKAREAGCNRHPMNDCMGGMQQCGVGRVDSGAFKLRRHGYRVIGGIQGKYVPDEHGAGGKQDMT